MSGRATLATARLRLATAATRISAASTNPGGRARSRRPCPLSSPRNRIRPPPRGFTRKRVSTRRIVHRLRRCSATGSLTAIRAPGRMVGDRPHRGRSVHDQGRVRTGDGGRRSGIALSPQHARALEERPAGGPQRLVVDRGPVRDRLGLLRARADARVRAAGRLGGRRDGVLRRLDLLHLGGAAAVPRGGERRPRTARRRAPADAPADLRATPDRLVVDADPARRHPLLQRRHVPGDAASFDTSQVDRLVWRPGAVRLDLLPDLGRCSPTSRSAAAASSAPSATSSGRSPRSTSLGCILFMVSAIAGYVVPSTGDVLDLAAANLATALGALCFLIGALLLLRESAEEAPARSIRRLPAQ